MRNLVFTFFQKSMKSCQSFKRKLLVVTVVVISVLPLTATALDTSPREYYMFPTNSPLYIQYFQSVKFDGAFANGQELTDLNAEADLNLTIARYVFNVTPLDKIAKGLTVDPQVFIPFGKLTPKGGLDGLSSSSGLADAIFLAGFKYPLNPDKRHFIGFTPFLEIPTGDYDKNRLVNLGNNRYSFTLQVGWTREIFFDNLTLGLVADARWFGTNNSFRQQGLDVNAPDQSLQQSTLYQYQAHLAYDITPAFALTATYSKQTGGRERINNVRQSGSQKDADKYRIGFQYFFRKNAQLEVQYGEDIDVDNGFKEDGRLNVRLAYIF